MQFPHNNLCNLNRAKIWNKRHTQPSLLSCLYSPVGFREQMPYIIAIYYCVNAHQYGALIETRLLDPERESNSGLFNLEGPALPSELPSIHITLTLLQNRRIKNLDQENLEWKNIKYYKFVIFTFYRMGKSQISRFCNYS